MKPHHSGARHFASTCVTAPQMDTRHRPMQRRTAFTSPAQAAGLLPRHTSDRGIFSAKQIDDL